MAYHGGQTSLPRAHRPRAPIMSVPAPLTAPLAPLRSTQPHTSSSSHHPPHHHLQQPHTTLLPSTPPPSSTLLPLPLGSTTPQVSLVTPRPDSERRSNEYVDTPFRSHRDAAPPAVPSAGASSPPPPPRIQRHPRQTLPPPTLPLPPIPPVTKQPQLQVISGKEALQTPLPPICDTRQSIICGECGRCSCPSCQQPRPLPECWPCTYHCSADTLIDYASCLCCVKGLFYHCSESDGGDTCVDEPCNCGPDRRTMRWGCLAALSFALPCLWFYWPLQCGKRVVEACYARHSRQGCRCRPKSSHTAASDAGRINTPEKRLLDVTPDF